MQTGVRDMIGSSLLVSLTVDPCGWRRQLDLVLRGNNISASGLSGVECCDQLFLSALCVGWALVMHEAPKSFEIADEDEGREVSKGRILPQVLQ